MKDIYRDYPGIIFDYWYPIEWKNRVPDYLNIVEEREPYQDYMFPSEEEEKIDVN